jgi:hypothetical protein
VGDGTIKATLDGLPDNVPGKGSGSSSTIA